MILFICLACLAFIFLFPLLLTFFLYLKSMAFEIADTKFNEFSSSGRGKPVGDAEDFTKVQTIPQYFTFLFSVFSKEGDTRYRIIRQGVG